MIKMKIMNINNIQNLFYNIISYSKMTMNKNSKLNLPQKANRFKSPNFLNNKESKQIVNPIKSSEEFRFKSKKEETFEFEEFHPQKSKYSLNYASLANENTKPTYLKEKKPKSQTNKSKMKKLISGKRLSGILPKQEYKILKSKERREKSKLNHEKEVEEKALALTTLNNRILHGPQTTAIDRSDMNYIGIEKKRIKNSIEKLRSAKLSNKRKLFNTENLDDFKNEERLSKRLSRLGVCSRRQAERLIGLGMVKVDGKIVTSNTPVDINNSIKINSEKGFKTPVPQNSRIWLYYKPAGFVCDARDEKVL